MSARDSLPEAVARMLRFTQELALPCALIGGVAVIARVFVRATKDVDLLVSCPIGGARRLLEVARRHGYDWEEADVDDFLAAGLLRMWGPPSRQEGLGLDVLLTDSPFNEDVVRRATLVEVLGSNVPVATPEDLLLMKLEANRPVDLDDAIAIKDGVGARLDMAYLRAQADALGEDVRRRLDALLG
ncbi:MAG: hypothetical protein KIT84_40235 [Labilithrix sp.]|nr:hypothetical protein [Labilithrix sp.]MCW5817296.1 hypothetical protein [Labilithrix sp.]